MVIKRDNRKMLDIWLVWGMTLEEPFCWWGNDLKEHSPCWWNWAELRHHLSSMWLLEGCGPGSHIKPQPSLLEPLSPLVQPVVAKQKQEADCVRHSLEISFCRT